MSITSKILLTALVFGGAAPAFAQGSVASQPADQKIAPKSSIVHKAAATTTDTAKTDVKKPVAAKTDAAKPDATKADATKADATKADATKTDATKTDAAKPVAATTTPVPAANSSTQTVKPVTKLN